MSLIPAVSHTTCLITQPAEKLETSGHAFYLLIAMQPSTCSLGIMIKGASELHLAARAALHGSSIVAGIASR